MKREQLLILVCASVLSACSAVLGIDDVTTVQTDGGSGMADSGAVDSATDSASAPDGRVTPTGDGGSDAGPFGTLDAGPDGTTTVDSGTDSGTPPGADGGADGATTCTLGDAAYSLGTIDPANPCLQCGATGWGDVGNGRACGDGGMACNAGACTAITCSSTLPDGGPIACALTNSCDRGAISCPSGEFGAPSCTDVGHATAGTSCDGGFCNGIGACSNVTCTVGTPCSPTNVCHTGSMACPGGAYAAGTCTDLETNVTNCTESLCDAGQVCSNGACTLFNPDAGSCTPTNACDHGAGTCTLDAGVTCVDLGTYQAPGVSCGGSEYCDGNGHCNCVAGGSCTIDGGCMVATYSCATGVQVCTAGSAEAKNGATCAPGEVCYSGTCGACDAGASCAITGNACILGKIACGSGLPVCITMSDAGVGDASVVTNAPSGTTCSSGVDNACDGLGHCNCEADASCTGGTVDPCALGATSCATGTSTCVSGGANPSMNGLACGSTGTCVGGRCNCGDAGEYYEGVCASCPAFAMNGSTSTVYVNAGTGTDDMCCGRSTTVGFGGPCQTISHAMAQLQGAGWTINFTGDSQGNTSINETYPIQLSTAVTLTGQGTATSCLPGVAAEPVVSVTTASGVWFKNLTLGTRCDSSTSGATYGVYIANSGSALLWNSVTIANTDQGIYAGPGAYLSTCGTVSIENVRAGVNVDGATVGNSIYLNDPSCYYTGFNVNVSGASEDAIHCESVTNPGVLSSSPSGLTLSSSGVSRYGIYAGTGCNLKGVLGQIGHSTPCVATRGDGTGIYVTATGSVSGYPTVSCMNGDAIVLASGTPTATIQNLATIKNNGGAGARIQAGSFTMYGTTLKNNHWGIIQATSATGSTGLVNISGYDSSHTSYPNTIYCNGKGEPGAYCTPGNCPNGADVWNNSALPLIATNNYWGDSLVAQCSCNNALASCSCTGSAYGDTTPPDDLDVLVSPYTSGGAVGTVTTTGNLILSSATCAY